jgi:hypothetical protein
VNDGSLPGLKIVLLKAAERLDVFTPALNAMLRRWTKVSGPHESEIIVLMP